MKLATEADFNGEIYTKYWHHPGFAKRARLFENFPEPILVVGCAYGYLVTELLRLEKSAWGIDASVEMVAGRENENVRLANVLDAAGVATLLAQLGGFGTVITEDMLPYLTDQEAITAAKNCDLLGHIVIHMVTESGQADLNYHPTGYWMTLTGQLTVSLEGM